MDNDTKAWVSPLARIVSGGQTGVDRAALDFALDFGIPCGGWCPRGRLAEDGRINARYPLEETPTSAYAERTEWNVRDSDGTLVLSWGPPSDGTAFTLAMTKRHNKPSLVVDLAQEMKPPTLRDWIGEFHVRALNVAGPRASRHPGIYRIAYGYLVQNLTKV